MESRIGVTGHTILFSSVFNMFKSAHWGKISSDVHQPRCFLDDPTVEGFQGQSPYVKVKAPCLDDLNRGMFDEFLQRSTSINLISGTWAVR